MWIVLNKKGLIKANRILVLLTVTLMLFSGVIGMFIAHKMKTHNKIYPNVVIDGINVTGMTKDEASKALKEKTPVEIMTLNSNKKNYKITSNQIGYHEDIKKAVQEAYLIGRSSNFFKDVSQIAKGKFFSKVTNIKISSAYDESKLEGIVNQIVKDLDIKPQDAKLILSGGISVKKEIDGVEVESEKLIKDAKKVLNDKLIGKSIEIPMKITKASVRSQDLSKINGVLTSFSTKYNSAAAARSENLRIGSQKVSNHILMQGETFSFNKVVGPRNVSNGFKMAPIIVKGKLEDGPGGGVCQISSTLYNAALLSGMQIVERRNHSIASSYVEKGRDATVVYGAIDFKFKNPLNSPIYITMSAGGGYINATIYGNVAEKKNIKIISNVLETIPSTVQIKDDPSLLLGQEKIEEKGGSGFKTQTFRVFYENNKEVKKELLSRDYYPPRKTVKLRGIKVETAPLQQPVISAKK